MHEATRSGKMSIILQLRLMLIVLGFMAAGSVALVYYYVNQMSSDSRVVNYAGIVRGGAQRLVKLEMASQPNQNLSNQIDGIIVGLIDGNPGLGLPPADDATFLHTMNQVKNSWRGLQAAIEQARRGQETTLMADSEAFFELTNAAVAAAEAAARDKIAGLHTVQLALLAINLLAVFAAWYVLRRANGILRHSIDSISGSASAISSSIEEQQTTTQQQAVAVTETTTTMEELNSSFEHTALQAEQAVNQSKDSSQQAQEGRQTVEQARREMENLKDKVEAIAQQMAQLSEQTGQISQVTELVSELADQTNLLALNASVQAAHAGEHGRGFAVVAGEIRKLADQSRHSAERIRDLVNDVQSATTITVLATEEGSKTVLSSMHLTQEAAGAFTQVAEKVQGAFEGAQQVSLNVREQVSAVRHVVEAMESLNNGAKEVTAAIELARADIERLDQTAKDLSAIV